MLQITDVHFAYGGSQAVLEIEPHRHDGVDRPERQQIGDKVDHLATPNAPGRAAAPGGAEEVPQ